MNNSKNILNAKNIVSISESLQERKSGICLEPNHAKMIWQGNKDIIVREKSYRFATNKPFYLIGGNECYGVLVLTKTAQITLGDFETLKNRHRITDEERKGWWPNKQVLYRYDFVLVEKFETPRLVKVKDGEQTFLHDVVFVGEDKDIEKIEQTKKYAPEDLRTDQLKNNFRIALAWHTSKTKGIEIPYSFAGIEKILKLTFDELSARGIVFDVEKMDKTVKEVFLKISNQSKKIKNSDDSFNKFIEKYKPMDSTKEYSKLSDILKTLYSDEGRKKYEIERNYSGTRLLVCKKDGKVRISSFYSLKDVTDNFKNLISNISKLSNSDFVLDCRVLSDNKNKKLFVSDILYKDKDLSLSPWYDRYKILKRLNFQGAVKEVAGIVVNNKDEARKALKLFCWMSNADGAIIKKYDSAYSQDGNSGAWVSFRLSK